MKTLPNYNTRQQTERGLLWLAVIAWHIDPASRDFMWLEYGFRF